MTTYRIIHYTKECQLGIDVFKSKTFNKTDLESRFYSLVKKLQPGESAEFMKEDAKFFYPSIQYVVNEGGKLWCYAINGNRRESKYNYI
jgi:hypothetical protein